MKLSSAAVTVASIPAAALLVLAGRSEASFLLTVDASNPQNTTFYASDGLSAASDNNVGYGILLLGTGTSDSRNANFLNGNFGPAAGGTYGLISPKGADALEINGGGNLDQIFTQGQTAFVGQSTVDLSFLSFPSTGVIGNIDIRDSSGNDTGVTLGQYNLVVPEPASLAMLAFGAMALLQRRSRTMQNA